MAKVFTIAEGLENMGALKTGGQGSVYKGRRIGEIITAVKLLPTPMHTADDNDKNYIDFKNEVAKLKKVNEKPNPNVVKILSSGFTESGSFPFIEMEFIEGPDLEELLKPPHEPIFTIKESIKVAEQLANALAHCHKVGVRHGDVKSNNVKLNEHTGNYVLLDFGLAIMSDEQRRTSLRQAGAIEFMAPEQNEGQMLFETDVYSYGIILFELLAGTVPFPQKEKGENARNLVRLAHMEQPPPDLITLRKKAMPTSWAEDKKEHEQQLPQWLVTMVYKCLEKKPEDRFSNGSSLHDYITRNSILATKKTELQEEQVTRLLQEKEQWQELKEGMQKTLLQYQQAANEGATKLKLAETKLVEKENAYQELENTASSWQQPTTINKGVSKASFFSLFIVTAVISAYAAYSFFIKKENNPPIITTEKSNRPIDVTASDDTRLEEKVPAENLPKAIMPEPKQKATDTEKGNGNNLPAPQDGDIADTVRKEASPSLLQEPAQTSDVGHYKVIAPKAYFHNAPDETTRRKGYLNIWNDKTLTALSEENGFIYIIYTNEAGQTSKGWIRKKDLQEVAE